MLIDKQIFDYCVTYFKNRIDHHKGHLHLGWGSLEDPANRCALGSMDKTRVQRDENTLGLGYSHLDWEIHFNRKLTDICYDIMKFNDDVARRELESNIQIGLTHEELINWVNNMKEQYYYIFEKEDQKELKKELKNVALV